MDLIIFTLSCECFADGGAVTADDLGGRKDEDLQTFRYAS